MSAPIEVSDDIVERVRGLCLALAEVTVRVDYSLTGARSTARSFDIRRRSFCLLVAVEGSTGEPVPRLVLRADPVERAALLSIGHPFFAPRAGRGRIGVLLTGETDWEEIRELVIESYRILAPKKLTALLEASGPLGSRHAPLGPRVDRNAPSGKCDLAIRSHRFVNGCVYLTGGRARRTTELRCRPLPDCRDGDSGV